MQNAIHQFKPGQHIEYTYPTGRVAAGTVVRLYTDKEIAAHSRSHGEKAAANLSSWIVCELTDEYGSHQGACHVSQLAAS